MKSPQAIGLGISTVDLIISVPGIAAWKPGMCLSGIVMQGGGMAATAMAAVSQQGFSAGYIGTAGSDGNGRFKMDSLEEASVDTSYVQVTPGPEQFVVCVFVDTEDGERYFSFAEDMGSLDTIDMSRLDRDYIVSAEYLLIDGFYPKAAQKAAEWMNRAGKKVVYDVSKSEGPVPAHVDTLLPYVDVLICGEGFAESFTGIQDIEPACREVLDIGLETVVQTQGEKGCFTATPDNSFTTPGFTVDTVDTTGAGDVFHGSYIAGLLHGYNLQETAVFANAAAAINCTARGGRQGIPDFDQTVLFLKQQGIELGTSY